MRSGLTDEEELAKCLSEMVSGDSLWNEWFSKRHCDACESIIIPSENAKEVLGFEPMIPQEKYVCAYCEVHDKCKLFPELDSTPTDEVICKMWLESEVH